MMTLRDAFFDKLYSIASKDRDVVLVSADMGAPSLDKFRQDLSGQYVNVGIAESNAIMVAVGLALSGKKVFVYAIMPFVTSRVYEFLKLDVSLMNVPITIIGVGSGYGYEDSGPTHHTIEDISIMRVLPNFEIINPSNNLMAEEFAKKSYHNNSHPVYIRLERMPMKNKRNYMYLDGFDSGFRELEQGDGDVCIVATGNTVDMALQIKSVGVIDLYRLKPIHKKFVECLSKYKYVISWEEHLLAGGLGSIISEIITDNDLSVRLKRIGVDDCYHYLYKRDNIQKKMNIDMRTVIREILRIKDRERLR